MINWISLSLYDLFFLHSSQNDYLHLSNDPIDWLISGVLHRISTVKAVATIIKSYGYEIFKFSGGHYEPVLPRNPGHCLLCLLYA